MEAIVFDPDAPRHFTFGEVAEPVPAAPDELVIEVRAISLNSGEVATGDTADRPGDVPGWDSAGVVLVAAADGSGPPVGTRVVGAAWSGAWARRRVLRTANVAVVPDALDLGTAAALSVAGVTALQFVRRLGAVVGRRVLVTGASGGVGRLAVQLAARAGAHVVAAVGSPSGASASASWAPTRSSSGSGTCTRSTASSSTSAGRCWPRRSRCWATAGGSSRSARPPVSGRRSTSRPSA